MTSERQATVDASETGARTEVLRLALQGLPPRQREALELAAADRLDVQRIAARLGADVLTVHGELRAALVSLRAVLDVIEPAPGVSTPHVPDA